MEKIFYRFMKTTFGTLLLASTEKGVRRIMLSAENQLNRLSQEFKEMELIEDHKFNDQAADQLGQYFEGERKQFSLPLDLEGTDFQKRVLQAVQEVPYGATRSYQDIAERIGSPKAVRAVGNANRTNPLPLIIPCHRIIGSDGSMTGYGGGIDLKRKLLEFEKKIVKNLF